MGYLFLRAFIKRGKDGNQQTVKQARVRAQTMAGEQQKDWRQRLLENVREEMLRKRLEEDEDDEMQDMTTVVSRMRMQKRKSVPAMMEDRDQEREEHLEEQMSRQQTLASGIDAMLPEDD